MSVAEPTPPKKRPIRADDDDVDEGEDDGDGDDDEGEDDGDGDDDEGEDDGDGEDDEGDDDGDDVGIVDKHCSFLLIIVTSTTSS